MSVIYVFLLPQTLTLLYQPKACAKNYICGCMKYTFSLLLCLLCVSILHAQSITGVWQGYFYSGFGIFRQQYKYEVQFNQLKNKGLQGVTYSYNTTSFYGKAGLKGIYQNAANTVIMKEDTLLEVRGSGGQTCLMTCYLDYSREGKTEILQGNFTSVVMGAGTDCGSGTVYLERVENSDFVKEDFLLHKPSKPVVPARPKPAPPVIRYVPKKKDTVTINKKTDSTLLPSLPDTIVKKVPMPVPPALKERKNDLVRTIVTNSPDIKVDLYDNGEIDGDTITVYHNNQVVAYQKGLSATALTFYVKASEQDNLHEFVMYANNLGKIPPNTALMVITTGGKRYELSVTSTKEKNAKVVIEYQPE